MPRTKKVQATQQNEVQPVEVKPVEPTNEAQPIALTKDDYMKARATIKQYSGKCGRCGITKFGSRRN